MKILFLQTRNVEVKHLHMALALKDKTDHELHLMHILPRKRRLSRGRISRFIEDAEDCGAFTSVQKYSPKTYRALEPDLTYIYDLYGLNVAYYAKTPKLVLDVLDLNYHFHPKAHDKTLQREDEAISSHHKWAFLLFGSDHEKTIAQMKWGLWSPEASARLRTQYPYVAESTLCDWQPKTDDFSVCYAGSIWYGYRDVVPTLARIAERGIETHVYMLNDNVPEHWLRMKDLAEKHDSLYLHNRLPLHKVKETISKHHAGLHFSSDSEKTKATYGMKPLEYAYAGVVPFCIGLSKAAYNLSDNRPFGYVTTTSKIEEDYYAHGSGCLANFDWNHHLMDTHLHEFKELNL